ncbi:MAG: hypothetical protein J6U22_03050 [Bacteroidaceae bacterium]|nr:hypothetical protein [Bacteroidaceae bacterium]
MRKTSFLSSSQKIAVKKLVYPLYRFVTCNKKINTHYSYLVFCKPGCHTYFGYYDVSPFQGEKIVYLEREEHSSVCKVVLNNVHNSEKQYITDSRAWNWQQGNRLRWLPNSNNVISFNDYIDGKYINRILDLNTKEEKRLNWPLYDIDCNGRIGITLNFERLGVKRPGYGYTCEPYYEGDLWNDGISIIDIEKNQLVKTITYKELSDNIKKADDVHHFYLNHLAFSPDGSKFLFFWIDEADGYHQASLGVYDIANDELIPLETEKKASHYVWDGNEEIICTLLENIRFARYYRINVKERSKKLICNNSLPFDGHPSIYTKDIFLTDTYPDTRGFQHIYLVNEKDDTKEEVIKIYSIPMLNLEMRTDLHPRLSEDKKYVAFDSSHDSLRKLLVLSLDK